MYPAEYFEHKRLTVGDCEIDLLMAGSGPPLLILHGFPENKIAWIKVAEPLATKFTVLLPDIPGYGDSKAPQPNEDYANYSKRNMGNVMVDLMNNLGFNRFDLAGHDRGARIAYRMALDHPDNISKVALLNIIPTVEVVDRINYDRAYNMEPWFFLAQPAPFPETLLQANADFYINHILNSWSLKRKHISDEARNEYVRCFKKTEVIVGICAEYRATKIDAAADADDRMNGKRIHCPVLVLWSENDFPGPADNPQTVWRNWADNVTGKGLPCGHFIMEELPDEVYGEFIRFF
jgi:haloacetate dehalogenase